MIGFGSLSKWTHIQSTLKFESCVNNDNECSAFEDSRRHNQFGPFFWGSLPYRIHTEAKWNFKESALKLQILFWTGGGPLENGWGSMGLGSLPNWTRIQSKKAACSQKHDLRDSGSGADRGNSNKRETAKCPLGWRREQELMPRCQMFDLNSDATYVEFKFDSAIWFNFRFRHRSG